MGPVPIGLDIPAEEKKKKKEEEEENGTSLFVLHWHAMPRSPSLVIFICVVMKGIGGLVPISIGGPL